MVKETLVVLQALLQMVLVVAVVVKLRLVVMLIMGKEMVLEVVDLLVKVGKDINLQ